MKLFLTALEVPVLVQDPETREYAVNIDPTVQTVLREIDWMKKLGLSLPPAATDLSFMRDRIKNNYDHLCVRNMNYPLP